MEKKRAKQEEYKIKKKTGSYIVTFCALFNVFTILLECVLSHCVHFGTLFSNYKADKILYKIIQSIRTGDDWILGFNKFFTYILLDKWTNRQMGIADCIVAFVTENYVLWEWFYKLNTLAEEFAQSGNWFMPSRGPPYVLAATRLSAKVINLTPKPVKTMW